MSQQPFVFDVPSLLGKNINEITALLRLIAKVDDEVLTYENNGILADEPFIRFVRDGWILAVSYHKDNGEVIDFVLGKESGHFKAGQESILLNAGNIDLSAENYEFEYLPAISLNKSDIYSGIIVSPHHTK